MESAREGRASVCSCVRVEIARDFYKPRINFI